MTRNRPLHWSPEEDRILLRYVKANPHNLSRCFLLVSEQLSETGHPRSKTAVAARWYSVLSKDPNALCFFTASTKAVLKNRKNKKGVETPPSLWNRFLRMIRNI